MNVLISGGAGFLGSHLCDFFISKNHKVIAVDNLITGKKENIKHLLKNKNFRFIKSDVTKKIKVAGKLDAVLHFASPASPRDYMEHPLETLQVGSLGTLNLLELAKEKKAKFLFASTSEIYGDPKINPQTEEYWGNVNPIGIRSVYDEAKRFSEALAMCFNRQYKLDTGIVRIFNTYGNRMNEKDGRAIPEFIAQALAGKPITVFGKGTQTRSFCFVSDLVDGIYKLLMSKYKYPVNIGNPCEITLNELAKKIIQLSDSKSKIIYKRLPEDDPKQRCPDITKAKKILKWKPKVNLTQGLTETIKYFKSLKLGE
ncbi:MAG: SDR family oxidoreductase [Endomicrobiaceae bacterium]|nr:SDR family oxidoreductase [Endomicrobiaceae bacterium]